MARRKRPIVVVEKDYKFMTSTREVIISATTLWGAKIIFQERFGYWPEKEFNYGHAHPNSSTEADPSEEA